jgi:hypothetical protein
MKKLLLIGFCFSCALGSLLAQEDIATAGHNAKVGDAQLSWTVGEAVTGTLVGGTFILTQGFQQTRLIISSTDDLPFPKLKLTVYPNPFLDQMHLRVDEGDFSQLRYTLLTLEGKALQQDEITTRQTVIDLGSQPGGCYLLQIRDLFGKALKTYRVTKALLP